MSQAVKIYKYKDGKYNTEDIEAWGKRGFEFIVADTGVYLMLSTVYLPFVSL